MLVYLRTVWMLALFIFFSDMTDIKSVCISCLNNPLERKSQRSGSLGQRQNVKICKHAAASSHLKVTIPASP